MTLPAASRFELTPDLTICRVLNGMWQVSGAHGTIEPGRAVDEMFAYHDAGFTTWDLADHYGPAEHLQIIADHGIPVVSNQVQYSIVDRRPEARMASFCGGHAMTLLAYGTLLGGLLSERYLGRAEPRRAELDTASLQKYKRMIDAWGGWTLFQELLAVLKPIADKHRVSIANVGTRYILDRP